MDNYDLIIIGGGPIGICCALEAKKNDLKYLVIEKGCLVNSLYNYPINMTFFSTSQRLEIGNIPFVSINPKPTRPEALEYYRRVSLSNELNIQLQEEVRLIEKTETGFIVNTSKKQYTSTFVIIATGFYDIPVLMNIPGENLPKLTHYYKDPHFYAMQKVLIAGANNSAVDAALETYRKGAEVTMVIRGNSIGERVKYWVKPDIENRIKEGSIRAFFNSSIKSVDETTATISTPEGEVIIENDYVIAMTGYQPDFTFLKSCGVKLNADNCMEPEYNPETQESNVKGLYLAGVVCGGLNTHVWFIENSREHAPRIINHIMEVKLS